MTNELTITEHDSHLVTLRLSGLTPHATATATGLAIFDHPDIEDIPVGLTPDTDLITLDITPIAAALEITDTDQPRFAMQIVITDGARIETWPDSRSDSRNQFTVALSPRFDA